MMFLKALIFLILVFQSLTLLPAVIKGRVTDSENGISLFFKANNLLNSHFIVYISKINPLKEDVPYHAADRLGSLSGWIFISFLSFIM